MPPKHPDNDPKPPKVRVRWIKKVLKNAAQNGKGCSSCARRSLQPRKWALLKVFEPEDRGYKAADQRRFQYSKKDSAFGKVGRFNCRPFRRRLQGRLRDQVAAGRPSEEHGSDRSLPRGSQDGGAGPNRV